MAVEECPNCHSENYLELMFGGFECLDCDEIWSYKHEDW